MRFQNKLWLAALMIPIVMPASTVLADNSDFLQNFGNPLPERRYLSCKIASISAIGKQIELKFQDGAEIKYDKVDKKSIDLGNNQVDCITGEGIKATVKAAKSDRTALTIFQKGTTTYLRWEGLKPLKLPCSVTSIQKIQHPTDPYLVTFGNGKKFRYHSTQHLNFGKPSVPRTTCTTSGNVKAYVLENQSEDYTFFNISTNSAKELPFKELEWSGLEWEGLTFWSNTKPE
ncbi:hypothetical protein [Nostoc sp. FACHB-110]|uniref:hypothetical protein n=1 Tax=Nostoc sp. FACHB-110 TaxID=2692834 RepID=UPI0016875BE2|nr:hypothetical protein [Nostoc sp. FACHB-110]MBD2441498.1 hypothetical protein [Nostoc sp. FACHB-110]